MHHKKLINYFKKYWLPIIIFGTLSLHLIRMIQNNELDHLGRLTLDTFMMDMNSNWAEFTALTLTILFVTAILAMIAWKWMHWTTDPENSDVQISKGMTIFG